MPSSRPTRPCNGRPGSSGVAAPLIDEPDRWARYVRDSLIEATIPRGVLLLARIDKPSLLRRPFELGCRYSGQVLSYTKMHGQLQDAGNTTTLAHYLSLLSAAGMVTGLPEYAGQAVRRRASSPKLQVLNTALMSSQSGHILEEAQHGLPDTSSGPHSMLSFASAAFRPEKTRSSPTPYLISLPMRITLAP